MEELEVEASGRGLERDVEVHPEAIVRVDRFHQLDVVYRDAGGVLFAIAGGEGVEIAPRQAHAALFAVMFEQGVLQAVFPTPRDVDQALFDLAHVEGRNDRVLGAHDDQQARQCGLRKMHLELRGAALEGLHQLCLDALALLGVVVLARDVDEAGDEAREGVGADEQANALTLSEAQDAGGGGEQLVDRALEKLVARVLLEDRAQRLAGVALGHQPGALDHALDLATQ